jgi:hypothetical protein
MRRALLFASLVVAGALASNAAVASASTAVTASAQTPQGRLAVKVSVDRFYATAAGTQASGTATATLTPIGQHPTTISKRVTLAAGRSGSCTVLHLNLEELNLALLGLNVHLEKVVLDVTGQPRGGVLGSLFCSLAHAKVKAARGAAAARLNHAIRRHGAVRPISFAVGLRATTAAAGECSVLDLILGPLNLNLLGLVVDLNKVHLTITANPAGGVLGTLFCGLANTKLP